MRRTAIGAKRFDDGAQSEVLGWTLLLGITITAIGVILSVGTPIIGETQDQVRVQNIVNSLSLLDERVSAATLSGAERKTVQLPLEEGSLVIDNESGRINISVHNDDPEFDNRTIYTSEKLGKIEYRVGDRIIGYQGGGIWQRDEGGNLSTYTSVPEIQYAGQTLTASIVNITSNFTTSGGSRTFVISNEGTERQFPRPGNATKRNPVNGSIRIVATSDYHEAWRRYFAEKTVGNKTACVKTADPDRSFRCSDTGRLGPPGGDTWELLDMDSVPNGSAVLWLQPIPEAPFQNAVLSTGGTVKVLGDSLVDSYNSEIAAYNFSTHTEQATIVANDTVEIGSPGSPPWPEWYGNIESEKNVVIEGAPKINGSVAANGQRLTPGDTAIEIGNNSHCPIRPSQDTLSAPSDFVIEAGACPTGGADDVTREQDPNVDAGADINVTETINEKITAANNNGWPAIPSDDGPNDGNGTTGIINISTGKYYSDGGRTISGKTVNFNTAGGAITIAVDDSANSDQLEFESTTLRVTGENAVSIYRGRINNNNALYFGNTSMSIFENDTSLFRSWVAETGPSGSGPKLDIVNATYRGVIYAPNNDRIWIEDKSGNPSHFFGAVVAQETQILSSNVHYDVSLRRLRLETNPQVSKINYLYTTDNKVGIE